MGELSKAERARRSENYRRLLDSGSIPSRRIGKLVAFIADGVQQDSVGKRALERRGAGPLEIDALVSLGVLKRCRKPSKFKIAPDPLASRRAPRQGRAAARAGAGAHHPPTRAGAPDASQTTVRPTPPGRARRTAWEPGAVEAGFREWARAREGDTVPVAPAERSYEVFRDEHAFKALKGDFSIFDDARVGVVNLSHDVEDYIALPDSDSAIVIVENRAAFMSLKRLLVGHGAVALYGSRIGGVAYKVSAPAPADIGNLYRAYDLPGDKPLLFWGDIDRAGAAQLLRVARDGADAAAIPPIGPYTGAYRAMAFSSLADIFAGRDLERSADQRIPLGECARAADLMAGGCDDVRAYILAVLASFSRIPQEAVPYTAMLRDAVALKTDR